jgi:23S rRNA (adenine2503-C2)-methyltransferase
MVRKLCGTTLDELQRYLVQEGHNIEHASRILISLYRKQIGNTGDIPNVPAALKKSLSEDFVTGIYQPVKVENSIDGTRKFLFRNEEGLEFETVYLPEQKRTTVCISTQAGCRMGCPFCVTGNYGFNGNLSAADMINQVISLPDAEKINHVVFMGMGEPMDNIDEVLQACKILTSDWGLAMGSGNITVSTVGLIPGIVKYMAETDCNLTISLHSPFTEERKMMIPAENRYPFREILQILRSYPVKKKRRLSVAYIMIKDMNDTDAHIHEIINLLKGTSIRVNLLPFHTRNDEGASSSSALRMQYFKHNLITSGISASVRRSRGEDISAACGLLASDLKN